MPGRVLGWSVDLEEGPRQGGCAQQHCHSHRRLFGRGHAGRRGRPQCSGLRSRWLSRRDLEQKLRDLSGSHVHLYCSQGGRWRDVHVRLMVTRRRRMSVSYPNSVIRLKASRDHRRRRSPQNPSCVMEARAADCQWLPGGQPDHQTKRTKLRSQPGSTALQQTWMVTALQSTVVR